MAKEYLKIEFKDEIYYFSTINGGLKDGGCIELQPDMDNSGYSWAYLTEEGKIMQHLNIIGTIEDIKIVEDE